MSARKSKAAAAATAADPGRTPAAAGGERQADYTWGGKPVFKCHAHEGCQFERLDNLPAVLEHELLHEETRQPPRESSILGKDGKPLKVEGE